MSTEPVVEALRELLRLKDLKTDANKINTSGSWDAAHRQQAMLKEHDEKKGEAWDAARRALHAYDQANSQQKIPIAETLDKLVPVDTANLSEVHKRPIGKPINQCDGCRRGIPVNEEGMHVGEGGFWGGDVQGCTANRYT
jgi:hypothetical protein